MWKTIRGQQWYQIQIVFIIVFFILLWVRIRRMWIMRSYIEEKNIWSKQLVAFHEKYHNFKSSIYLYLLRHVYTLSLGSDNVALIRRKERLSNVDNVIKMIFSVIIYYLFRINTLFEMFGIKKKCWKSNKVDINLFISISKQYTCLLSLITSPSAL